MAKTNSKPRQVWRGFASDNYAGVHPEVLKRISKVNVGHEIAYGDDSESEKFRVLVKKLFGPNAVGFPVFNGTGANVVALQAALERWEAVICAETSHIHVDEGGAPEKMGGIKLWTVPTPDGKLTPELIDSQVIDMGVVHRSQPGVVSITQTSELGTLYSVREIRALADRAHKHGLLIHMDGARLSNAAAALKLPFKKFTSDLGIDLVSLGGTKIGSLAAEAVIVTNSKSASGSRLAKAMPFLRKTSMQLPSKMRYVSAQLNALFEDDARLALANARHANAMAERLYRGVAAIAKKHKAIKLPNPTQANAVFPILPLKVSKRLQKDYRFYVWNQATGQVRWMCAWDTTEDDVDGLLKALTRALQNH